MSWYGGWLAVPSGNWKIIKQTIFHQSYPTIIFFQLIKQLHRHNCTIQTPSRNFEIQQSLLGKKDGKETEWLSTAVHVAKCHHSLKSRCHKSFLKDFSKRYSNYNHIFIFIFIFVFIFQIKKICFHFYRCQYTFVSDDLIPAIFFIFSTYLKCLGSFKTCFYSLKRWKSQFDLNVSKYFTGGPIRCEDTFDEAVYPDGRDPLLERALASCRDGKREWKGLLDDDGPSLFPLIRCFWTVYRLAWSLFRLTSIFSSSDSLALTVASPSPTVFCFAELFSPWKGNEDLSGELKTLHRQN